MASGITTIDFGAFPGKSDASVAVTGQAAIVAGSIVGASLRLVATADHSADEHMLESLAVFAGNISAGTGFTIYAVNTSQLNEPLTGTGAGRAGGTVVGSSNDDRGGRIGGIGTRIYGLWTVAWAWV